MFGLIGVLASTWALAHLAHAGVHLTPHLVIGIVAVMHFLSWTGKIFFVR